MTQNEYKQFILYRFKAMTKNRKIVKWFQQLIRLIIMFKLIQMYSKIFYNLEKKLTDINLNIKKKHNS